MKEYIAQYGLPSKGNNLFVEYQQRRFVWFDNLHIKEKTLTKYEYKLQREWIRSFELPTSVSCFFCDKPAWSYIPTGIFSKHTTRTDASVFNASVLAGNNPNGLEPIPTNCVYHGILPMCNDCKKEHVAKVNSGVYYPGTATSAILALREAGMNDAQITTTLALPIAKLKMLVGGRYKRHYKLNKILTSNTWGKLEVHAKAKGITVDSLINYLLDDYQTTGTLEERLLLAIENNVTVPSNLERVGANLYYNENTQTYVQYDIESKQFVAHSFYNFCVAEFGAMNDGLWFGRYLARYGD